jgi:hypothetical protein
VSGCVLMLALAQFAQTNTGELRVAVTDAGGLPLPSAVELVSEANRFQEKYDTDSQGILVSIPRSPGRIASR